MTAGNIDDVCAHYGHNTERIIEAAKALTGKDFDSWYEAALSLLKHSTEGGKK